MSKFILLVYGSLCTGKSTTIKIIQNKHREIFHGSMDNIKWFISDYSSEKYARLGVVNKILLAMNSQAVKERMSIIVEGNAGLMLMRDQYLKLAKEHNFNFIQVNIEAPYDVLLQRLKNRVLYSLKENIKISVTEEDQMRKRYEDYFKYKINEIPTFYSHKDSANEIAEKIEKILKIN